ncbi:acid protease [Rickenella mellea]|uniref:Acid protease n=1 Tax=Rickenella mellea TaxID=50990 RepID=A0A4Y7PQ56_9AGAM|nr:acid protease [Rickenella mellea]
MQLGFSFSVLLASLLVALSVSDTVNAAPTKRSPTPGMVTLPLKRLHRARDDIHPLILLQQHVNRGLRRVARMTGRAEPSDLELRENLNKRMYLLPNGPFSRKQSAVGPLNSSKKLKRFNRIGFGGAIAGALDPAANSNAVSFVKKGGKGGKGAKGKGALAGAAGAGAGAAAAGVVGGQGGADANGVNATGTAAAGAAQGSPLAGIDPVDVAAQNSNTVTPASKPTGQNSLGLDIEKNDVGYLATIQIGTPPRDFKILMDSGSADFWVGSETCVSENGGGCGNHTFLGPQSSSTFVDTKAPFTVTYGSGNVAGTIITDNVAIAGLPLDKHTFGTANQESVDFSSDNVPFDGLMGLAQSGLSQQKVQTPVESLASQGAISDAITSFKLGRLADGNNDGEVTFGGIDSTKIQGNTLVTFNNVNTQGFWEGAMDAVTVGGQDLGLSGRTAILDTGTTLIIAPAADAAAVHAAIPGSASDGQGGFTIPCTTSTQVALSFGGQSFAIDPRDMVFAPVDPNNLAGDCVSGISSGQIGGAQEWLVGDVFLKNAYLSTDVGKNQISLAKLA